MCTVFVTVQVAAGQERSETDEDGDYSPASQVAPQDSTDSDWRLGTTPGQGAASHAGNHHQVDSALQSFVDRMSSGQQLPEQVVEVQTVAAASNNSRTAWANWMSAELQDLPDHLWLEYQKQSFALVMRFKERAQALQLPHHL